MQINPCRDIFEYTMKKAIIVTLIAASTFLILDVFNAGAAIVAFILTGTIPGTGVTLSASAMLIFYALVGGFTLARLTSTAVRSRQALQS